MKETKGIRIEAVEPGSPADEMGLVAGDVCLQLNGHDVEDFLDCQYYLDDATANSMLIRRTDGDVWDVEFELDEGESLGIQWPSIRPRICRNKCIFCFVDQLPRHVRPSLRIKDEDYRHSFLHGNFITLGNLTDHDLDRILEQRLSPLYVSVHTMNPALRREMIRCPRTDRFFEYFEALVAGGIALHTQVVLCPGINDGAELERTLDELAARHPAVRSVGIVPVGLTGHREGLPPLTPPDREYCRRVITRVSPRQAAFRKRFGTGFVYLADEFYLQAEQPLPAAEAYDEFPQLENGIGMVRDFLEEFAEVLEDPGDDIRVREASFVTGTLFAPVLRDRLAAFNTRHGTRFTVIEAENRFLGGRVTVAGLLAGGDILAASREQVHGAFLGVPSHCISMSQGCFLDDMTLEELERQLGCPVVHLKEGADGFRSAISQPPSHNGIRQ